jgi:NhaP-type Na+/H+ or K+/H+ antiporter
VLPGAGLVASTILGKTLSQRKVELPRPFYTGLQVCLVGLLGVLMGLLIPFSDLLRQPLSQIGFALLILVIRPLLVMAATIKQKLTPAQKRSLWAVSPRGIVTLGVAATAAELLGHGAMPQALILPVLSYWVVLTTNLVPWLLAFQAKTEPTPS